jgi:predicted nucleotidyltransferase
VPDKTAPANLLAAAAGPIAKWCDGWYLFGAQAAMLWGRPRLTADVDITVRLRAAEESDAISGFCRDMEEKGFRLRISDPEFLVRTRVLPFFHISTQLPLDVVLAGPGLEDAFIERAILVDIEGLPVPVVSPEDLIVMKILAGRAKDLEDVRTVLIQGRGKLDIRYIRSVLETLEQALGRSDLLPLLQSELNRLNR